MSAVPSSETMVGANALGVTVLVGLYAISAAFLSGRRDSKQAPRDGGSTAPDKDSTAPDKPAEMTDTEASWSDSESSLPDSPMRMTTTAPETKIFETEPPMLFAAPPSPDLSAASELRLLADLGWREEEECVADDCLSADEIAAFQERRDGGAVPRFKDRNQSSLKEIVSKWQGERGGRGQAP